jgi:hypothetical protein
MIGKIIGAAIGERVARGSGSGSGAKGAFIGALVPVVARRLFGPLGLALAGGYAVKKYYDSRKARPQNPA